MQKLPQLQTDQSSAILTFHFRAIASLLGIDSIVWLSAMVTHSWESRANKSLSEGKGLGGETWENGANKVAQPLP